MLRALRHILEKEGWSGLYDGLGTDTAATITSKYVTVLRFSETLPVLNHDITSQLTASFTSTSMHSCVRF